MFLVMWPIEVRVCPRRAGRPRFLRSAEQCSAIRGHEGSPSPPTVGVDLPQTSGADADELGMTNSERTPLEDMAADTTPAGAVPAAAASAGVRAPATDWDAWFTPARFAGLLFVLLLAAFPEVWGGTHTFFYRDYGCFGYPLAHHHREAFWHGEVPLWNALNNCGLPHLAQWNTMVFYPLSLVYVLGPMPWALGVFVLGHLWLAGFGMYHLARHWTGHAFASAVAGLAWALNGLALHALMWPNNIAALAWMPIVVLLVSRAVRDGGRTMLLAALAGATQVLTGAPEMVLFTAVLAGGLAWLESRVRLVVRLRRLAVVGAVVAGLTAVQMLPFLDLLRSSQRDGNFVTSVWAMPAWGLANFIVPLFRCSASLTGGVFSQVDQQWTSSYYAGLAVLVLAVVAVWRVRDQRAWLLGAVVVGSLVLALGESTPVYPFCRKYVPGFNVIRFPIKFVVPALFALPLLAGLAVSWWQRLPAERQPAERRRLLVAMLVLGCVACALPLFHIEEKPGESAVIWKNGLARAGFLALVGFALLARPRGETGTPGLWWRLAVLLGLGVDALTHAPRQNPAVPVEVFARDVPQRQWTPPTDGARAMMHPKTKAYLDYAANPDLVLFSLGQRRALVPNWNLLENIPVVGGFYALYPREQKQVLDLFRPGQPFPEGLADFLAVTRISSGRELFGWEPRERARPPVSAGQQPVFLSEPDTLRALAAPEFDPARTVLLPEAARPVLGDVSSGRARVVSTTPPGPRMRIEVEAEAPSVMTVAQTHYHWWRATVNGVPTLLWRANHAFQAVVVPAGRSVVELAYHDRGFVVGAVVTGLTLLGCAAWGWAGRRRALVAEAAS